MVQNVTIEVDITNPGVFSADWQYESYETGFGNQKVYSFQTAYNDSNGMFRGLAKVFESDKDIVCDCQLKVEVNGDQVKVLDVNEEFQIEDMGLFLEYYKDQILESI